MSGTRDNILRAARKLSNLASRAQTEDLISQARALNDELYSDVRNIPLNDFANIEQSLRSFCQERHYTAEYTEAWMSHRYRLYLSLKRLETIIGGRAVEIFALELGGESPATDLLGELFPMVKWHNPQGDLRLAWEFENQSVDLVVAMEILEHFSDFPDGYNHGFFRTGLKSALRECYRVLRPGGFLFATTPNAASVFTLQEVLRGAPPWVYTPHVREYTVYELFAEFKEAGFNIRDCRTVHCMTVDRHIDYTPLFLMLLALHFDPSNRGDDIFIVACKER